MAPSSIKKSASMINPITNGERTLLKLPAELRNTIYEHVFATNDKVADLKTARPPGAELLATCSQVHQEAKSIYDDQCTRYWRETSFTLFFRSYSRMRWLDSDFGSRYLAGLDLIRRLRVSVSDELAVGCGEDEEIPDRHTLQANGLWRREYDSEKDYMFIADGKRFPGPEASISVGWSYNEEHLAHGVVGETPAAMLDQLKALLRSDYTSFIDIS